MTTVLPSVLDLGTSCGLVPEGQTGMRSPSPQSADWVPTQHPEPCTANPRSLTGDKEGRGMSSAVAPRKWREQRATSHQECKGKALSKEET